MIHPILQLKNVGQIKDAAVEFADLTILVGPQASGKSIFLQFLNLVLDSGYILEELNKHGHVWKNDIKLFLDIFLGEGMHGVWKTNESKIIFNEAIIDLQKLLHRKKKKTKKLFYIPAQRVLTLRGGWPRPFSDYSSSDPFSVRDFSEQLRMLMEKGWGRSDTEALFPQTRRLKTELRDILDHSVFHGFGLHVDTSTPQKRLILKAENTNVSLPFMVWSAGQREFVPLLMGSYWLLPPSKVLRRKDIDWAVIEEPETGLHPKAISAVLLLILDLLSRGYKVCVSTHSTHILDVVWALKIFKENKAQSEIILDLFDVKKTPQMIKLANEVMKKEARVYYFNRETGCSADISNLDPGSMNSEEAGWGGLSEFSGRVAEIVAQVVNSKGNPGDDV